MQHARFPTPDIDVASLFLSYFIAVGCGGRPDVITQAVVHAINHLSSVLRTISVSHVALPSFFVEGPVTSVTAGIVCINLNSEAVAHFGDVGMKLIRNQRHFLNNQG